MRKFLKLRDGATYLGEVPDIFDYDVLGEVVFNTGTTGYVESLTDPSYAEQILVFSYPLIGNYGVHMDGWESDKIHAKAVVVSKRIDGWSHPGSDKSFLDWLIQQKVPVISGVDTRSLTQHLRDKGSMAGAITNSKNPNFKLAKPLVSIDKPKIYNSKGRKKIILVDCGAKENIVRSLVNFDASVKRVPFNYDFSNEDYDGVVISNGPGNPEDYQESIEIVKKLQSSDKPIFGICLGTQLMALAAGAKTYKLKFGHRGHNQPCMDAKDQRCYITSQNHGYAIDAKSLPRDWKVSFTNLNDGSVEGIEHKSKPFFSVQFHPEACPGPTDTAYLFERFYRSL